MGTVGREQLYWQDTPGTLQVGIDPGVEYTGLAFVSWPHFTAGTVLRGYLLPTLLRSLAEYTYEVRCRDEVNEIKLKIAYEEPGQTNCFTWCELGRIRGIIDCWASPQPDVTFVDHRPCTAQQVRARVERVQLVLDSMEPFDTRVAGLSDRLPVHAREAMATLIR